MSPILETVRRQKSTLMLLITGLLAYLFYDILTSTAQWENPPENVGTRDLIAFWGGVQVYIQGGNPYRFSELFEVQKLAMPELKSEQYFLNPPWAIPLFYPIMVWPFQVSRILWFLINLAGLFLPTFLIKNWFGKKESFNLELALATISFTPAIMMLWFGQLSLFIYLSLICGFHAYRKRKDFLAGILWTPLTLKPHLLYLAGVFILYRIVTEKRWKILLGGVLSFCVLNALVLIQTPEIFTMYANIDRTPLIYQSSTLPTLIRLAVTPFYGYTPAWPVFALPIAASTYILYWLRKNDKNLDFAEAVSFFSTLSLALAPYAWMYDYSITVVTQIVTLLHVKDQEAGNIHKADRTYLTLLFLELIPVGIFLQSMTLQGWLGLIVFNLVLALFYIKFVRPKSKMAHLVLLLTYIQILTLITGAYFNAMLSFVWFPLAMLLVHKFAFEKEN